MDAAHTLWTCKWFTLQWAPENWHSWELVKAMGRALVAQTAREQIKHQDKGFTQKWYRILMVCPRLLIMSHKCNGLIFWNLILMRKLYETKLWKMFVDKWPTWFCITKKVGTLCDKWQNKREKKINKCLENSRNRKPGKFCSGVKANRTDSEKWWAWIIILT